MDDGACLVCRNSPIALELSVTGLTLKFQQTAKAEREFERQASASQSLG
jgi:hypothetical protein